MWELFDKILCLTTPRNKNRLDGFMKSCEDVGLKHYEIKSYPPSLVTSMSRSSANTVNADSVSVWDIFRFNHKTKGPMTRELANNHYKLVLYAFQDATVENVLIMEDDARFDKVRTLRYMPKIIDFLQNYEYDCFNFGAMSILPLRFNVQEGVAAAYRPLLCHCYALSRSGMRKYIDAVQKLTVVEHCDKFLSNTFSKNYYVAYPSISFQCIPPALYATALEKLPATLKLLMKEITFESFCKKYEIYFNVGITIFTYIVCVLCVLYNLSR